MSRITWIGFSLALSGLAVAAAQGITLLARPKVGDVQVQRIGISIADGADRVEFSVKATLRVARVNRDGSYLIQSTESEGKAVFGGETTELADQPDKAETVMRANGEVADYRDRRMSDEEVRINNATMIVAPNGPIRTGDVWTREIKKGRNAPRPLLLSYEAIGTASVGGFECVKIRLAAKETAGEDPIELTGSAWVATKDAGLARMDAEVKNAPYGRGGEPVALKLKIERLE